MKWEHSIALDIIWFDMTCLFWECWCYHVFFHDMMAWMIWWYIYIIWYDICIELPSRSLEKLALPSIIFSRVNSLLNFGFAYSPPNLRRQGKTSAPPAQSPEQRDTTPSPPPPRGGEGERKTDRNSQKSGISPKTQTAICQQSVKIMLIYVGYLKQAGACGRRPG